MNSITILIPTPFEPDTETAKLHAELVAERDKLEQKRAAAMTEWHVLAARFAQQNRIAETPNVYGPAESAQAAADAAAVNGKLLRLEAEQLELEVPLMERIVKDYIDIAAASGMKALAVAVETIELAKAHVFAVFKKDFNPKVWPANATAIDRHVAQHPIVLAAEDRLTQLKTEISDERIGQRAAATQMLTESRRRLGKLRGAMDRVGERGALASTAAQVIAKSVAAQTTQAKATEKKRIAAQREAEAEAARRVGAL